MAHRANLLPYPLLMAWRIMQAKCVCVCVCEKVRAAASAEADCPHRQEARSVASSACGTQQIKLTSAAAEASAAWPGKGQVACQPSAGPAPKAASPNADGTNRSTLLHVVGSCKGRGAGGRTGQPPRHPAHKASRQAPCGSTRCAHQARHARARRQSALHVRAPIHREEREEPHHLQGYMRALHAKARLCTNFCVLFCER